MTPFKRPKISSEHFPVKSFGRRRSAAAVGRHQDVLLVLSAAPDELLDDVRAVELPRDGDEATVVLAEALAPQAEPLGDPATVAVVMLKFRWGGSYYDSR